ncbi:hypothetical protein A4A49_14869 [Nicotiana attenuata]|uniref:Secreted protein n=1 Tax=Nicotiana attenuata TaxID=49451 RepID=A0A314LFH4_NICAT|nr:hypothetical protein A4A49_14869 [Nicotiana attenuata]
MAKEIKEGRHRRPKCFACFLAILCSLWKTVWDANTPCSGSVESRVRLRFCSKCICKEKEKRESEKKT